MIDQFLVWFQEQAQSEIFGGLAAVSLLGYVMYACRAIPEKLFVFAQRMWTVELTVRSDDPMFEIIAQWLAQQDYMERSRRLKLKTRSEHGASEDAAVDRDNGPEPLLVPAPGWHYLRHGTRPILLHIDDGQASKTETKGFMIIENITLRTLGRSANAFAAVLNEAIAMVRAERRIQITTNSDYGWAGSRMKLPRPLDSVVTAGGVGHELAEEMRTFFESQSWFIERGIPWRRGYMLSGPPGTGKSSLVFALASELNIPIYSLSLGANLSDGELLSMLMNVPERSILLIEDVDAFSMTQSRKQIKDDNDQKKDPITLSALLNALDGVTAGEGRVLFMTTNHPDAIDSALTRPGRIDRKIQLDYFGLHESLCMWDLFFNDDLARQLFKENLGESVQPAALQEHFMRYRDSAHMAAKTANSLFCDAPANVHDDVVHNDATAKVVS